MKLKTAIHSLIFGILTMMITVAVVPVNAPISDFLDVTLKGGYVVSEVWGNATIDAFADTIAVSIPSGASVSYAYLYLGFFVLFPGQRQVEFAGNDLGDPYDASIGGLVEGCARYDVGSIVTGSGNYGLTLSVTGDLSDVFYGAALLVIYSQPTEPLTRIMVQDGAEFVHNGTGEFDKSPYTVSFAGISTASATGAMLTVMAVGGEVDGTGDPALEDDQLRVNGAVIDEDAFHGDDGYLWDVTSWDVYTLLTSMVDVDFDALDPGPAWFNGYVVDFVILAVTYPIPMQVDIKPSSLLNPFNLKGKGVLPVAIYGTEDFDAITIDPETVRLTMDGVGVAPLQWSLEDINEDGYTDLLLKFKAQEVIQTLGLDAFNDGDVISLTLTGDLKAEFGGTPIEGQDTILILEK